MKWIKNSTIYEKQKLVDISTSISSGGFVNE